MSRIIGNLEITVSACLAALLVLAATEAQAIDYGTPVPDGQHPSVGMVVVRLGDKESSLGTGTLIRSNVVLTAAHVIQDAPTPGHISFRANFGGGQQLQARVIVYRTHAGYFNLRSDSLVLDEERPFLDTDMLSSSACDLALLLLDRSAPEGITFPALANEIPAAGSDVTAVGFGLDEGKQNGNPRKLQGTLQFLKKHENALLFRTPRNSSQRTDHGDSGGPLLIGDGPEQSIAAITHGFYTAIKVDGLSPDEYGIYVPIADRREWIETVANQLTRFKPPSGPAFYLVRGNRRTPFLALTARQVFSLANADTPVERLVGRIFSRGMNEPIPGDVAAGWQKRYQLPPGMLTPVKP